MSEGERREIEARLVVNVVSVLSSLLESSSLVLSSSGLSVLVNLSVSLSVSSSGGGRVRPEEEGIGKEAEGGRGRQRHTTELREGKRRENEHSRKVGW